MNRLLRYYHHDVLAMFHTRSEKYLLKTDEFQGSVRLCTSYTESRSAPSDEAYLNVAFGFRACKDGEWAVAAYGPDLAKASEDERQMWVGFEIVDEEAFIPASDDERHQKWVQRYIMGNWDVEDGPIAALDHVVGQVNAIAECVANERLITSADIRSLCFPAAQNTHRYQDAHAEVYKLLVDGLSKTAIKTLGDRLGIAVNPGDKATLTALKKLFPADPVRASVFDPLERVCEQRRLSSHRERSEAQPFVAFEEFGKDLRAVVVGMEALREDVAQRLNVDVARCEERASAMRRLPRFDPGRPTQPRYAIFKAHEMVGKCVKQVQTGELVSEAGCHESEALIIEFSDGSEVSIEAATNFAQVIPEDTPTQPEALHITFWVTYVPPMLPYRGGDQPLAEAST